MIKICSDVAPMFFFAIIICVVYTVVVLWVNPREKWNWFHGFIATLVSVLFGLVAAMGTFYFQKNRTDESDRTKFRSLISSEFSHNRDNLSVSNDYTKVVVGSNMYQLVVTTLQPTALEIAAESGLFTQEQTTHLFIISRHMKLYNDLNAWILHAISQQQRNEQVIAGLCNSQTRVRKTIIDNIKIVETELNLRSE